MKREKKGSAAVKRTDPRHSTEVKRLLKSKQKELESQESKLLFLFVEFHPDIVSEPMLDAIWSFLKFLKKSGYHIIDGKTVFCFPFSHTVKLKDLK